MNEKLFEEFLTKQNITEKAIKSRIVKGNKAEELLNMSFDRIVANDDLMFDSLKQLKKHDNPSHSPLSNALRKYYEAVNGKPFPKLNEYK